MSGPRRRSGTAVAGLLAASLLTLAGPDLAAADGQEKADKPAESMPSLPSAPDRVGRIRRDADGRIVPVGPSLPPDENAARVPPLFSSPPPPYQPSPGVPAVALPYDTSFFHSLQNRQIHAERARLRQQEIDRILREEAVARGRGVPVDAHGLTPREAALARELARQDAEVQQRERRRYQMAQPYAGHPEFWFVTGPRGLRYAATGMTRFDVTMIEGDPAATIRKLEVLRQATLASVSPSRDDYRIARELERLIGVLRQRQYGAR